MIKVDKHIIKSHDLYSAEAYIQNYYNNPDISIKEFKYSLQFDDGFSSETLIFIYEEVK